MSVAVATMVDMPDLSHEERAAAKRALEEARAQIDAGKHTVYDPDAFTKWFWDEYRIAKAKQPKGG